MNADPNKDTGVLAACATPACMPQDGMLVPSVTHARYSAVSLAILPWKEALCIPLSPNAQGLHSYLCHPRQPDRRPAVALNAQRFWIHAYSNPRTHETGLCVPLPHLPGPLGFVWRFWRRRILFHIKININGQNAKVDEFQRPSLRLQREFKFAFTVLDQVLSPPLGAHPLWFIYLLLFSGF